MKCVMCSSTDSSLMKLQTYVNNNTLKEITIVLPDLPIPEGPVYVCVPCEEQVTSFHQIKETCMKNLCHLNLYNDTLKRSNDIKFKILKVVSIKSDQMIKLKNNLNSNKLSLEAENQLTEKESNSTSIDKSRPKLVIRRSRFECNDCHKVFVKRGDFVRHIRIHTGERPYTCPTCQKTFTRASSLNIHKLTHTGEKPHECDVCHKTFVQKSDLITHKLIHTNIRPYPCSVCRKGFTRSSNLRTHMLIHAVEKQHQCHICEYKCTQAAHLKRHIQSHTSEKS